MDVKTVLLYDEISPAGAKEFVRELAKLSPTAAVTIAINSPGGSVPAGDAIAAAIDRHRGPTTARIDGVAASAASYVAMFCDRVVMSKGSFLMIHEPFASMVGGADELEGAARTLRVISARYAVAYAARCGADEAKVRQWMKRETWFDAAGGHSVGCQMDNAKAENPKHHHRPLNVVSVWGRMTIAGRVLWTGKRPRSDANADVHVSPNFLAIKSFSLSVV